MMVLKMLKYIGMNMNYGNINNSKMIKEYFAPTNHDSNKVYYEDLFEFPSSNIWGHLGNKFSLILERLLYLNEMLKSIYENVELYKTKKKNRENIDSKITIRPYIEIIHVINDLRMIIDDLISLEYIWESYLVQGEYPTKIKISSIGELLSYFEKPNYSKLQLFEKHKDFLFKIKEVSNTYKHSFINSDILFYSHVDNVMVFAGKNPYNNFNKDRELLAYPLNEIINEFNVFFEDFKITVKQSLNIYYESKATANKGS